MKAQEIFLVDTRPKTQEDYEREAVYLSDPDNTIQPDYEDAEFEFCPNGSGIFVHDWENKKKITIFYPMCMIENIVMSGHLKPHNTFKVS